MRSPRPRLLILSSCTGVKASTHLKRLMPGDFLRGRDHVRQRERTHLANAMLPARDLYQGQHHLRLMDGVRQAQASGHFDVDLRILSAGYGIVRACDRLAPYECTFQGMGRGDRQAWSEILGLREQAWRILQEPYELGIVLLGKDYLSACQLAAETRLGGPTVLFCAPGTALSLPSIEALHHVVISAADAKRFACGLVALKGELGRRLLVHLANHPDRLVDATAPNLLNRLDCYDRALATVLALL